VATREADQGVAQAVDGLRPTPRGVEESPVTFSRRMAVKAIGAIAVWPYLSDRAAEAFATIQSTQAPPALAFLTAAQYTTLDALAETIIPTDDHSPGARDARVADYIDLLLSESDDPTQRSWTAGLALLDAESRRRFKAPYARLTLPQATELLTPLATNEDSPRAPLEQFFKATKDATIRGYYTSEIGIQKELEYKGNRILGEFVGCTHPEHGYEPGQ
jgi:Gluconate 2-dehydrogenase subunit 3